jgi:glycosyltransferase involved in cell wall biosynthesis
MRVVIEMRALVRPGSSVAGYVTNLVRALDKADPKNEYVLLVPKGLEGQVQELARRAHVIGLPKWHNVIWNQWLVPRAARKVKADLIHYTKSDSCWWRPGNLPVVTTIHGLIYRTQPKDHPAVVNAYWLFAGRRAARISRFVVAVSQSDFADMVREGYPTEKIRVIPLGVDNAFWEAKPLEEPLQRLGLKPRGYFIQVGHFSRKKNHAFTLRVCREVLMERGLRLVFVGDDSTPCGHEVRVMVREMGLENHVVFAGVINPLERPGWIPALLHQAVASLFPSLYEGFGMPAVESIAAGCPVLASDRGALPEVLGADNGLSLDSAEEWEKRLRLILTSDHERTALLEQQRRVVERYRWETIAKDYVRLYEEARGYA